MSPPNKISTSNPWNLQMFPYMPKDVIKDLEMWSLSWIIQVGPKCNHMYPYKREVQGVLREIHRRREGDIEMEAEIRPMKPRNVKSPVGGRGKRQNLLQSLCREHCRHIDFRLNGLQNCDGINLYFFRLLSLWKYFYNFRN